MTRETMLRPLAELLTLHEADHGRHSSTAELDTMSCAAPVQAPLQAGTDVDSALPFILVTDALLHGQV